MPTAVASGKEESERVSVESRARHFVVGLARRPAVRELLIFLAFCMLTALMTWPWVLHMRDAVADRGDPYMIAWTLWWDYHQTFHDPVHLFDANVFYPYKYTLAFSENDYGIALPCFPLFAAGLRALTVSSVATFLGFAFCGYGAFRLTRTLTGSNGAAWIAGIVFAFVPFRFHVLSHLHYLFAGWIPLLLEALILFARERSWRRAAWLGVAFTMNALSCVSWFIMTLVPLALTAALIVSRHPALRRDRAFWVRGGVALGAAALVLLPFLIPYYIVSVKYGLRWQPWEFALNSPTALNWLAAESRNKLWQNFGAQIPGGHKLFPGLLAPLLALAALRIGDSTREDAPTHNGAHDVSQSRRRRRLIIALDLIVVLAAIVAALALGYGDVTYRAFGQQLVRLGARSVDHALVVITVALSARLWLAPSPFFPRARRPEQSNETRAADAVEIDSTATDSTAKETTTDSAAAETTAADSTALDATAADATAANTIAVDTNASDAASHDGDAIGVALIWTVWGFLSSLGANFFLNRWLHDYVLLFQSIRLPSRWAMICYVGLAVLAGVGASRLACRASRRVARPRVAALVFVFVAAALVFELRAFPLAFERGEVEPTALALRLKRTEMRGGLVELPSEEGVNRHFYMLRAADHERPLVNATSSFLSPTTVEINVATRERLRPDFLDLLEKIPASYLVIHNDRLPPERRADYETFLARAVARGRLRFVNRFDDAADLYAVTKTEPDAQTEAALPFAPAPRDWAELVEADPVNVLGQFVEQSQTLYRVHVAAFGSMPRYAEFIRDTREVGRNVEPDADEREQAERFGENLRAFADETAQRADFKKLYDGLDDAQYVERLYANAAVNADAGERASLADGLSSGRRTRAGVLLKVADDPRFVERERHRSFLLLHYFGYLRRDPGDPPDRGLDGFNFWLAVLERTGDERAIASAFLDSEEYKHYGGR